MFVGTTPDGKVRLSHRGVLLTDAGQPFSAELAATSGGGRGGGGRGGGRGSAGGEDVQAPRTPRAGGGGGRGRGRGGRGAPVAA